MPSVRADSSSLVADPAPVRPLSGRAMADYGRQLVTLGFFFLINAVFSPPCWVVALLFGRRIAPATGQRLIRRLTGAWLRSARWMNTIQVEFPDAGRLQDLRGVIVAPNHPSLMDAIILLSVLPRAVCVMRGDLAVSPILGGMARLAGFVPNDSGRLMVRGGVEKIRRGENLLIFPEGTRTRTRGVNAFKKGFALVAKSSGAPIQTIFIEREGMYLSKQMPLFARAALPVRFRLRIGDIIHPRNDESAQELSRRVERYFQDRIENTGMDIRLVTGERTRPACFLRQPAG